VSNKNGWWDTEDNLKEKEITAEEFDKLQNEWLSLEKGLAQGYEEPNAYKRIDEIEKIINDSPWEYEVDTNKVVRII